MAELQAPKLIIGTIFLLEKRELQSSRHMRWLIVTAHFVKDSFDLSEHMAYVSVFLLKTRGRKGFLTRLIGLNAFETHRLVTVMTGYPIVPLNQ